MARERGGFGTSVRNPGSRWKPVGREFFTPGIEMEKLCFYDFDGVTGYASSAGFAACFTGEKP
jgi:hypothetical protein